MANPRLTKNFLAGGTINPSRFVKPGADDNHVVQAAAGTDSILGVSQELLTPGSGDRVDVVMTGIARVKAGGVIAFGALVTSDGSGQAVSTAPTAGTVGRVAGIALQTAANGDLIDVLLTPGQRTTPAA